jgi:hypothetical protein
MTKRFTPAHPVKCLGLFLVFLWTSLAWTQSAKQQTVALPPELEPVRAALEKYQDPLVAIHDGYLSTIGCADFPHDPQPGHEQYPRGAMGVHFLNPSLIGPSVDPMHPQILLYEPVGGKFQLVGAEWFVPLATGVKERPQLLGHPFWGPMEGHEPLMPKELKHYDLHVWLFKGNPNGVFAPTNPDVNCTGYAYDVQMHSTHHLATTK